MRKISVLKTFFTGCAMLIMGSLTAQQQPKGSLFIIGGGTRTPELMQAMLKTASLTPRDHIAVLPMSSSETDTAYYYTRISLEGLCNNTIADLNFTGERVNDKVWLDSLRKAKLIYITGGDQSRFMKAVLNTPVFKAIHDAYNNGAMIAGTSAGAAVMSKLMITGNELLRDTTYSSTYKKIWYDNIELERGLGLLDSVIIDQHFIARSRYNRLLTAIAEFPFHSCIGIDESTAIIVQNKKVTVVGESQVVFIRRPVGLGRTKTGLVKFRDVEFGVYVAGEQFFLY